MHLTRKVLIMEKKNLRRYYSLGIVIVVIIAVSSYLYMINKNSHPFDPVYEMRRSYVQDYELIETEETNTGTMVYSVGKVNEGSDNMYFTDMVKKTLLGYKWVGGGGHVDSDLRESHDFTFSAQLLNETQNIRTTIFGVFSDDKIKNITVSPKAKELCGTVILEREKSRYFYYIPLENDVVYNPYFIFTIIYKDNKRMDYLVSADEISDFQEGKQIYFYE